MDDFFWAFVFPITIILLLYMTIVVRGNRREVDERRDLLEGLKKNDRIVTHSGIVGTIASLSNDGQRLSIRTGESKIEILRSAVRGKLEDEKTDATTPPAASA